MPEESTYLALGDSTGVGVGARAGGGYPERMLRRLSSVQPGLRLVNLCESGATSSHVLRDQVPQALRRQARLISIGVGINDVGMQQPDEAFALNLEEIVASLVKLGAPIVLINLPDLALAPAVARVVPAHLYEQRLQIFNEHIESTAARHRLTLIDLWSQSRVMFKDQPGLFSSDGFHPSAEGYEAWAELMLPAVESLLRDRSGAPRESD